MTTDESYPVDAPARVILSNVGQSVAAPHAASHAAGGTDPLALTAAQITDLGTMGVQDASDVNISGGAIAGATITTNNATISGGDISGVTFSSSAAMITGGSISNTVIGEDGAADAVFSALSVLEDMSVNGDLDVLGTLNITSPVPVASGGTAATNAEDARTNLELGNMAIQAKNSVDIDGGAIDGTAIGAVSASTGRFTGLTVTSAAVFSSTASFAGALTLSVALTVPNGGTGAATLTGAVIGNGASAMTAATSSTAGQVLRCTGANTFAFGALDLANASATTGISPVTRGGTGVSSLSALFDALGLVHGNGTMASGTSTIVAVGVTTASDIVAVYRGTVSGTPGHLSVTPGTDIITIDSTEASDANDFTYFGKK